MSISNDRGNLNQTLHNQNRPAVDYDGAHRLIEIEESQTLYITKKVRALRNEGLDVVGLTLGEPNFDTPDHIRNAGIDAIRAGHTHYPPVAGIPELREAVAAKFRRDNGLEVSAENIVVSTGAKQSLVNVVMSLVNSGDEVVLVAPYWVSYTAMVHMAEGEPIIIPTNFENDYKISPEELEEAITPQTRLLIMNSPSNPTGSMYTEAEWLALAEVLERHPHVFLLSDEIYEFISYGERHFSPGTIASIADRVITVNGVSKGFAMTGWRIGFIAAPKKIAALSEQFQGQVTSGANSIAQWATVAAMNGDQSPTKEMVEEFAKRRKFMYTELSKIEGMKVNEPSGAFYFYPDLSAFIGKTSPSGNKLNDIDELCEYLLTEGLVAVIPGSAFGTDSHIRISYAYSPEELKLGCERLNKSLSALK